MNKKRKISNALTALSFVVVASVSPKLSADPNARHDGDWYTQRANELNQAMSELSTAENCSRQPPCVLKASTRTGEPARCAQNPPPPMPSCIPDHLSKAANLLSKSVVDSEYLAEMKSQIETYRYNLLQTKDPMGYSIDVFRSNAQTWYPAIAQTMKNFRARANDISKELGTPNSTTNAASSSAAPLRASSLPNSR